MERRHRHTGVGWGVVLATLLGSTGCTVLFPFDPARSDCANVEVRSVPMNISAIDLDGDGYAITGAWSDGVAVYDQDNLQGTECSRWVFDDGDNVYGVFLDASDDTAWIANGSAGVFVVSNYLSERCHSEPSTVASYPGIGEALDVVHDGQDAYFATGDAVRWWAGPPDSAVAQGTIRFAGSAEASRIAVSASHVFVALGWEYTVAIISRDRPSADWNDDAFFALTTNEEVTTDVFVQGEDLFVAVGDAGIRVYSAVPNFEQRGEVLTPGWANVVVADGEFVFVCGGGYEGNGDPGFVQALRWRDGALATLFTADLAVACLDMDFDHDRLYIADDETLDIVDRGCAVRP